MDIKKATFILKQHNKWRQGADIPMEHPKTLTEAINVIVNYLENTND